MLEWSGRRRPSGPHLASVRDDRRGGVTRQGYSVIETGQGGADDLVFEEGRAVLPRSVQAVPSLNGQCHDCAGDFRRGGCAARRGGHRRDHGHLHEGCDRLRGKPADRAHRRGEARGDGALDQPGDDIIVIISSSITSSSTTVVADRSIVGIVAGGRLPDIAQAPWCCGPPVIREASSGAAAPSRNAAARARPDDRLYQQGNGRLPARKIAGT